ncbi:MAG: hypothetical protein Q8Q37_00930, partial [bacterium]|nr:hypothetical protein [bacterium]
FDTAAGQTSFMVGTTGQGWGSQMTGFHNNSYGWLWRFDHSTLAVGNVPIARIPDIGSASVNYANSAGSATNFSGSLAGDVTGTQGATVVGDDSHSHTSATISGLGVADFSSANISQWTNDSGYITSAIGGSGTTNYVPKFTSGTTLGNSLIYDNGTTLYLSPAGQQTTAGGNFSATGMIQSGSGGFKFPDGTTQTTAGGREYVGATPSSYTGAQIGGYSSADSKCNAAYAGSRMCAAADFSNARPTANGWYNTFVLTEGESLGVRKVFGDCAVFGSVANIWGAFWAYNGSLATYAPSYDTCVTTHNLLCCK